MKIVERLRDATSRIKMPLKGKQAESEEFKIIDNIKASEEGKTEEEIVRRAEDRYLITAKEYWGSTRKGIDLLATFGHARYYSCANYLTANMTSQPLRIVGVITLSLAVILGISVSMKTLVASQKTADNGPAVQSLIKNTFGVDYSTATTLSENKKAHAKYGSWAYVAEKRTGKADFTKFAGEVLNLSSGQETSNTNNRTFDGTAFDPKYEGYSSAIWNANYNQFYSPAGNAPVEVEETGQVPTLSASGFWTLASNIDHLDKTGALITSKKSNEKVAAVFHNGQLSVNLLTDNRCFNVFGQPLNDRCQSTDLTKTETEFPVATLNEMFDRKVEFDGASKTAAEVAKSGDDLLWYIRLPEAPSATAGLTQENFEIAKEFVRHNFQADNFFSMNTVVWALGGKLKTVPKIVSSEGFFNNPEVVKLMEKTAVVGVSDSKDQIVVASFVDGRVSANILGKTDGGVSCRVLFGKEYKGGRGLSGCSYGSVGSYNEFIKTLYAEPVKPATPGEIAFYANAPFEGVAAHKDFNSYEKWREAIRSDFMNYGLAADKWQSPKKGQIPLRKADGIFDDPQIASTISKADVVFIADPKIKYTYALATNINGELQLELFKREPGYGDICVNVFGDGTHCSRGDISADKEFSALVKSMFNKKKED